MKHIERRLATIEQGVAEEDARSELVALIESEDRDAFRFVPPRLRLVSLTQQFQDSLTGKLYDKLEGVIIASRPVRALWPNQEGVKTPICNSTDGIAGHAQDVDAFVEMAEHSGVIDKVKPFEPMACNHCPFAQWGSGKDGRGQACKEMRRLLLWPDDSVSPVILSLPPTSVARWDRYASAGRASKTPYFSVRTIIQAEAATTPTGTRYSRVTFTAGTPLSLKELEIVRAMRKQYETIVSQQVEDDEYASAEVIE